MIIKGFTITRGQNHAAHLLRADENEHVSIHEVRGFVSDDLHGAFKESQAIARGTKCERHLFSCAFAPPESAALTADQFILAIDRTEKALGLDGQPRAIVFHEKHGRRHAHCVWSRIDAQTMTARHLSHWKTKLGDVSRSLHEEFGIEMPRGLKDRAQRDKLNFSQAESQIAKRAGDDPRALKESVQECWAASDTRGTFEAALAERALLLARGDKRGFVIVDYNGAVHALARVLGVKSKDVTAKLGAGPLRTVEEAKAQFGANLGAEARAKIQNARERFSTRQSALKTIASEMTDLHRDERAALTQKQDRDWIAATKERQARLPRGLKGLWAWMTGKTARIKTGNDSEAKAQALEQAQAREVLEALQREERRVLIEKLKELRKTQASELWQLRRDLSPHIILGSAPRQHDNLGPRLGLKLET